MGLPALGNTALGSRLFTKYKVDSQVSSETYHQLINLIKDAFILSGGKEIYDTDPTESSRVEMGIGMYALTIKDIPRYCYYGCPHRKRKNKLKVQSSTYLFYSSNVLKVK